MVASRVAATTTTGCRERFRDNSLLVSSPEMDRRSVLETASTAVLWGVASDPSHAATSSSMATINTLLNQVQGIPTFCIVSAKDGAAYMVFKNDQAMAIGYAFTTFTGALAVLGDAQRNAKAKGYYDVWENATITSIPLDIAIRLALKKRSRTSPKDQTLDTILQIIPGAVRSTVKFHCS
jgi:type IV secretory pathway VirB2 component (pilin)